MFKVGDKVVFKKSDKSVVFKIAKEDQTNSQPYTLRDPYFEDCDLFAREEEIEIWVPCCTLGVNYCDYGSLCYKNANYAYEAWMKRQNGGSLEDIYTTWNKFEKDYKKFLLHLRGE